MELSKVPTEQLLDLRKLIKKELISRKVQFQKDIKSSFKAYDEINDIEAFYLGQKTMGSIPPHCLKQAPQARIKYLNHIIRQDWSNLFDKSLDSKSDYYVYAHCDPRNVIFCGIRSMGGVCPGMPFYVGKGRGERAFDFKRNQGHGIRLKDILSQGYGSNDIIHFFKKDLLEHEAFELEAKLVYFFGTIYESERKGVLLNLDLCRRPKFDGYMEVKKPNKK